MPPSLGRRVEAANLALLIDGRLGAVGDFFAADYVAHGTDRDMAGHAAIRRFVAAYRRAFPDLRVDVEVLAIAKDRVAWQRTLRATHKGDYKGFVATGRPLVWRDMVVSRFEEGLMAEDWVSTDLAERLLRAAKPGLR